MKNYLLSALAIIMTSIIYAQGLTSIDIASENLQMSKILDDETSVNGSAYIQPKYSPVRIKGYDNQVYLGRYNAYNGQMVVDLGDKRIALDNEKDYDVVFTQFNTLYRTFSYTNAKNNEKRGFLVVINEGDNFALLKEENIKYYDAVEAASSYQQDKPAKYKREADNYYAFLNGKVTFIPTKKKTFLKQFSSNEKELKAFMKENSISLKDEKDLVELTKFLSTLS